MKGPNIKTLHWYLPFSSYGLVQLPDRTMIIIRLRETWLSRGAYLPGRGSKTFRP